ncbi:MAG TPA: protein kinase [Pyrinomonadaceae bacterium]|nr:protein kinase [Pyrinomonadaceae bacterium]
MIGHTVGSYKITEKIGEGGMGAVFKGIDVMLDREVAIKMLRPELARQAQLAERFRSEAVTLARLNHPNIATLYSFLRQNDDYFMVMEYVRGETLEQLMTRQGPMNCETAVTLFCHVLEGMEHAHGMNIIHRDIKPANMMLTERGSIKVMDFGIARVLGTDRMTRAGHLVGTIEYMPPEQVRGAETDARSDIYSLGILLYEMITGRVPFTSPSEYDLMRAQVEDAPPPPREFAPQTPVAIEQSILRALAKNKDERFQTAGEFRLALLTGDNAPARSPSAVSAVNVPAHQSQSPPVKETRLAPSAAVVPAAVSAAQMKATRLAPSSGQQDSYAGAPPVSRQTNPAPAPQTVALPASFLDRLNWKHYAAAGAALFVFVAVLVGAPLGLLLTSRQVTVQPKEREEPKPTPVNRPSPVPTVAPAFLIPPQPGNSQPPQTDDGDNGDNGSNNGSSSGARSARTAPKRKAAPPPVRAEDRPPPKPEPTPPPNTAKKEENKNSNQNKEKKRGFFGKLKDKVPGIKLP